MIRGSSLVLLLKKKSDISPKRHGKQLDKLGGLNRKTSRDATKDGPELPLGGAIIINQCLNFNRPFQPGRCNMDETFYIHASFVII